MIGSIVLRNDEYRALLAENERLREEIEVVGTVAYVQGMKRLESENAKLRKLIKNALAALDNNCAKCAYADCCTILKDCKCQAPDRLRDDLRDLGMEVSE